MLLCCTGHSGPIHSGHGQGHHASVHGAPGQHTFNTSMRCCITRSHTLTSQKRIISVSSAVMCSSPSTRRNTWIPNMAVNKSAAWAGSDENRNQICQQSTACLLVFAHALQPRNMVTRRGRGHHLASWPGLVGWCRERSGMATEFDRSPTARAPARKEPIQHAPGQIRRIWVSQHASKSFSAQPGVHRVLQQWVAPRGR